MKNSQRTKIAIVGAGHVAQVVHIPGWRKNPDVEVVAVCDTMKTKAKWVAERYGIPTFTTSIDELLKSPDIDAIDICTQTDSHQELAIAALSAGKHVLVEKPMARTFAEATEMVKASKKHKRNLMVAMNVRFRRDAITLKSFLDGNELGEVFYAKSGWLIKRDFSHTDRNWLYDKNRSGGGVLMDLGIQMLDVSWWLLGNNKPTAVKAVTFNRVGNLQVEDSAACMVQFDDGAVLTLEVSWTLLAEKDFLYANLFGATGSALINPLRVFKDLHGNLVNIVPTKDENASTSYKRSYSNEMKHFVDCLRQNTPLQAGAAESAERLRIIDAFYQSATEGREVLLP